MRGGDGDAVEDYAVLLWTREKRTGVVGVVILSMMESGEGEAERSVCTIIECFRGFEIARRRFSCARAFHYAIKPIEPSHALPLLPICA